MKTKQTNDRYWPLAVIQFVVILNGCIFPDATLFRASLRSRASMRSPFKA